MCDYLSCLTRFALGRPGLERCSGLGTSASGRVALELLSEGSARRPLGIPIWWVGSSNMVGSAFDEVGSAVDCPLLASLQSLVLRCKGW